MHNRFTQWLEIDRSALVHNLTQFRALTGSERKLLAMVKANAYGHGSPQIAPLALKAGADWLGVHTLEEGIALRKLGLDCPVLVVGYVPHTGLEAAVEYNLRVTVYNRESVERLAAACRALARKARIHVKVETGTYRQGVSANAVVPFMRYLRKFPDVIVEGLSSHFANIEDTTDHSYANFQLENYRKVLDELSREGLEIPVKHFSCSAAAILFPETHFDLVRVGIGLYGLWPSRETYLSCLMQDRPPLELQPVLSWKARIAQLKNIPRGAFIGYGCTYKSTRDIRLAAIPVGYSDGYPRGLSNIAHVLIRGKRAPLRGRVAMNFIMADVTDIPEAQIEDIAILIGEAAGDSLTADTLASWAGTINYEIVARLNPQIPREVI